MFISGTWYFTQGWKTYEGPQIESEKTVMVEEHVKDFHSCVSSGSHYSEP